jgi:hypothetical protein
LISLRRGTKIDRDGGREGTRMGIRCGVRVVGEA